MPTMKRIRPGLYRYGDHWMLAKRNRTNENRWHLCTAWDIDQEVLGTMLHWKNITSDGPLAKVREVGFAINGVPFSRVTWPTRDRAKQLADDLDAGEELTPWLTPWFSDADMHYFRTHLEDVPRYLSFWPGCKQLQKLLSQEEVPHAI